MPQFTADDDIRHLSEMVFRPGRGLGGLRRDSSCGAHKKVVRRYRGRRRLTSRWSRLAVNRRSLLRVPVAGGGSTADR